MIIYKRGGGSLFTENIIEEINEYFKEEIIISNFNNRPKDFSEINSTFCIRNNGEIIFFGKGKGAGGSQSFENLSFDIYRAMHGNKVGIYLLNHFPNNVNKSFTVKILGEIGLKIYREERLDDVYLKNSKSLEYVRITERIVRFLSISHKTNPYNLQPKQSFNIIPILHKYAKVMDKKLIVDSIKGYKIIGQKGPSKRIQNYIKQKNIIISEDDESSNYEDLNYIQNPIPDNNIIRKVEEIPKFQETEQTASKNGIRNSNNLHDIMVVKMYNKLIKCFGRNIIYIEKDVNPIFNTYNADIHILYKEGDLNKINIYEVKSFISTSYPKAIGQLLCYRERISNIYNIPHKNIELKLVIPFNDDLNKSFIEVVRSLKIEIINI